MHRTEECYILGSTFKLKKEGIHVEWVLKKTRCRWSNLIERNVWFNLIRKQCIKCILCAIPNHRLKWVKISLIFCPLITGEISKYFLCSGRMFCGDNQNVNQISTLPKAFSAYCLAFKWCFLILHISINMT